MFARRDTRWGAEDVRRHWVLKSHCECLAFPCHQPSLALPSCLGRMLWRLRAASARHPAAYQAQITRCLLDTARDWVVRGARFSRLVIGDLLVKVRCMDPVSRSQFVSGLERVLRNHGGLVTVSLENCGLRRGEGVRLLSALAASSRSTLQKLSLHGAFATNQNPLQEETSTGPRGLSTKMAYSGEYQRALSGLTALWSLELDHGQLSTEILVSLVTHRPVNLRVLQLQCLEHDLEFPAIPDNVWKLAVSMCPQLSVHLVIVGVAEHEKVRRFLRPSMPVRGFCISSGLQLFRSPSWNFNVTLRLLAAWYCPSLARLCIHLHRSREYLDTMLSEIPSQFPQLQSLEFVGTVHNTHSLEVLCRALASGHTRMKRLRVQAQESTSSDRAQRDKVSSIQAEYYKQLAKIGVELDLTTYKM